MARHKFYNRFIRPLSTDSDQAEREIVLNYLLTGIMALSIFTFVATFVEPFFSSEPQHVTRLLTNLATILFIVGLYFAARYQKHYRAGASLLTLLIALFGCFVALRWGILDPYSGLLLSLAVVMAGILIGARYSLYVTGGLVLVLALLQYGESSGHLRPDLNWTGVRPVPQSVPGDVISIGVILFIIAMVSWLFNRQMEMSLRRARLSEKALKRQKELLEVKVQKRTQELEAARLEQMSELYRFAELGRLSTALFHDLANNLTNISIDIEGLKGRERSGIMHRIRGNVRHIDDVVKRVRQQMQGKSKVEVFNVMDEINEIIDILSFDAGKAGATVSIEPGNVRPSLLYRGDLTRFRQILLNVVSNAVEAYEGRRGKEKPVIVRLERSGSALTIDVTDFGPAIPGGKLDRIFEPFYTTKPKGIGIGLFIVKQVVGNDFGGSISVTSDKRSGTTFSIRLPKSYYAKASRR